jgi:hypothetical protein
VLSRSATTQIYFTLAAFLCLTAPFFGANGIDWALSCRRCYERHSYISSGMRINPRRFLHSKVHFALIFYDRPAQSALHAARLPSNFTPIRIPPLFWRGISKELPTPKVEAWEIQAKRSWPQCLKINNWKYPFNLYYYETTQKTASSFLYLKIFQKSKNFTEPEGDQKILLLQQNSTPLDQLVKDAECKP